MPNAVKRPVRWCMWCGAELPVELRPNGLFCSRSHAVMASVARKLAGRPIWSRLPRTRKPPLVGPRAPETVNRGLLALVARLREPSR